MPNSTSISGQTKPPSWKIWWQLLRPHTLTASFVPVFLGTILSLFVTPIHWSLFFAMLMASVLIQAATNMFNEYYDFKRGLDTKESVGIGGAIVRYGISSRTVMAIALAFCGGAMGFGLYICLVTSWWLAAIGILCIAAGYFYTGGPWPIAYTPFGEIVAGFFMGVVIIQIAFYIQTNTITAISLLLSVPTAILVGAILMANNIRDRKGDQINGRRTLAILLGHKRAVFFLASMFSVAYLWVTLLVLLHLLHPWVLLIYFSLPLAKKAIQGFMGLRTNVEMVPAMATTAKLNSIFGFLLALGLLFSYLGQ